VTSTRTNNSGMTYAPNSRRLYHLVPTLHLLTTAKHLPLRGQLPIAPECEKKPRLTIPSPGQLQVAEGLILILRRGLCAFSGYLTSAPGLRSLVLAKAGKNVFDR
jgi:hypothetical protein